MTLCNMSIEAGARAGMIAPDDTTFEYLEGRPRAPQGAAGTGACARWRALRTDDAARFDRESHLRRSRLEPMITYGTNPGMGMAVRAACRIRRNASLEKALRTWPQAGRAAARPQVDVVFIGSCTNSRCPTCAGGTRPEGRKVAAGAALVVPGSQRQEAGRGRGARPRVPRGGRRVARGRLLDVHRDERRPARPGSTRLDQQPQLRGPQGAGGRTFLASPLTAAAAARHRQISRRREYL
jgi:3-isopropylmalate/(R)-2-methylmalate dehydratase large subunit